MGELKSIFSNELNISEEKITHTKHNEAYNPLSFKNEETPKRNLGILQGEASFKMKQDYKMTEKEFLGL